MRRSNLVFLAVLISFLAAPLFAQSRPDALILYRNGRYREAVDICLEEIAENPRRLDAYAVLGWSLLRLQDYENVIKYGLQALAVSKYDHRIMEILGEAYFYTGKNVEALKYFQEYVNLQPTGSLISDVYYFMGEIFIQLGEFNHADIAFTTALHHNSNVARWWGRLGYSREMAHDYPNALKAYERALTLNNRLEEALRGRERVQAAAR
jgi:tetratricopeptide (TPR) repeat protein